MTIRVAINGFGRIGRLAFRVIEERDDMEVVAINDVIDTEYLAYMLRYDSVHGRFSGRVEVRDEELVVDGRPVKVCRFASPSESRWGDIGVDAVIESTGLFTGAEAAGGHVHQGGAGRVVISAPSGDAPMFVMGVNHEQWTPDQNVISNASCTTNCLAPVARILHERWGIEEGLMTTVHAATASQKAVDSAAKSDWRGGRSVNGNIIPASTGAAKAVGKVIPDLDGKLTGMAFRIPTVDVSVVDLTVRFQKATSLDEILGAFSDESARRMKGILGVTHDAVVSSDFIHDPRSSVVDATACIALNDRFFKIVSWYDNEWGYASRVADLIAHTQQA